MTFKCLICGKEFNNKYLGGIRDTNLHGNNIICGKCYNEGKDFKDVKK